MNTAVTKSRRVVRAIFLLRVLQTQAKPADGPFLTPGSSKAPLHADTSPNWISTETLHLVVTRRKNCLLAFCFTAAA